jgi:hypothetical protein
MTNSRRFLGGFGAEGESRMPIRIVDQLHYQPIILAKKQGGHAGVPSLMK